MTIEAINTPGSEVMYNNFHFSQAIKSNGIVICSGQIGMNEAGKIPESAEDEFRHAWQAVGRVLEASGLSFDNILEYTTFHVGLQEHMASFMKVRDEFVSEPWPAWTAIGITELAVPRARVEIRVVGG